MADEMKSENHLDFLKLLVVFHVLRKQFWIYNAWIPLTVYCPEFIVLLSIDFFQESCWLGFEGLLIDEIWTEHPFLCLNEYSSIVMHIVSTPRHWR